jgi:hypothetical protein
MSRLASVAKQHPLIAFFVLTRRSRRFAGP